MDDACGLFPAFLSPFLRLASALIVGPEAAEACYDYLSKRPPLVVEFATAQEPGLQVNSPPVAASDLSIECLVDVAV
jgi:hypothetical protein